MTTTTDIRLTQLEAHIRACRKRIALGRTLRTPVRYRFLARTRHELAGAEHRHAALIQALEAQHEHDYQREEQRAWLALHDPELEIGHGGRLFRRLPDGRTIHADY